MSAPEAVFLIHREGSMLAPERRATLPEAMAEAERQALAWGGDIIVAVRVTTVSPRAVNCDGAAWPPRSDPEPEASWR